MEAAASNLSLFYSCVQIYNNMFYNIVHEQVFLFHPNDRIAQSSFDCFYLSTMPHLMFEAPG